MYKFYLAIPNDLSRPDDVAMELGLSSATEYVRIALEYLVQNRRIPAEFVGKRSIARRGRRPAELREAA